MIFSVQRYLEDAFQKRGLHDPDQYAVSVANLYGQEKAQKSDKNFLAAMHRIRTAFFRSNSGLDRTEFEKSLVADLKRRFKKKADSPVVAFPGGVSVERNQLKQKKRTISGLLKQFKHAVESRAIDTLWVSRKQNKLHTRPETIAQGLFAVFAKGVINDTGLVLRELVSGIGFVDVSIIFSARTLHLVELKILTGAFVGVSQLEVYMKNENRKEGWLLVLDSREATKKTKIPNVISSKYGTIRTLVIDINPTAPSKLKSKKGT